MSIIKRLEKLGAKSPQWSVKPKPKGLNEISKNEMGSLLDFAQDENFSLGAPEKDSQAVSKGFSKGIKALKGNEKSRLKQLRSLLPSYQKQTTDPNIKPTDVW